MPHPEVPSAAAQGDSIFTTTQEENAAAGAPASSDSIRDLFDFTAEQLNAQQDRRERLVKLSRDVTIFSKRLIFLLHRTATAGADTAAILAEALHRHSEILDLFARICDELVESPSYAHVDRPQKSESSEPPPKRPRLEDVVGEGSNAAEMTALFASNQLPAVNTQLLKTNFYRYMSAFAPGMEEFAEAALFWIFIRDSGRLATQDEVQAMMGGTLPLPSETYACGLGDLTGELMRFCINQSARGASGEEFASLAAKLVQSADCAWPNIAAVSSAAREKARALQGSVRKVEGALYSLRLRSLEASLLPKATEYMPPSISDIPGPAPWPPFEKELEGGTTESRDRDEYETEGGERRGEARGERGRGGRGRGELGFGRGRGRWGDARGRGRGRGS